MPVTAANKFVNDVGSLTDPKYLECVHRGQLLTSEGSMKNILNVYHFRRKTIAGAFDAAGIAASMDVAMSTPIIAAMNSRYTQVSIDVRALDDPSSMFGVDDTGVSGAIDTDSYDSCSAVYMLIRTGFRGRNFMGSKHFTPLNEADTTEDELTGAGLTRWQAVQTMLQGLVTTGVTDANGNVWFPIVLSRELSNLEASPSVFTGADWNLVLLNLTIGTMRHRKEKTKR